MVNYQKLYAILCGAASEALDLMPEGTNTAAARRCLEQALEEVEEAYIQGAEDAGETD